MKNIHVLDSAGALFLIGLGLDCDMPGTVAVTAHVFGRKGARCLCVRRVSCIAVDTPSR